MYKIGISFLTFCTLKNIVYYNESQYTKINE